MNLNFTLFHCSRWQKAILLFFSFLVIYGHHAVAQCWKSIETGNFHTVALKTDGTLWAWGVGGSGQLGTGNNSNQSGPVQVGTDNDWAFVAVGHSNTMAIKTNGTLWAWGLNDQGQLGIGNTINQFSPVQVGTATDWAFVATGHYHTVAIKTNGTLWSWGYNNYGQLGIGNNTAQLTPLQVGTDNNWASVSAGDFHTMARKTDGTLWGWGYNTLGMLGNGNTTHQTSPVQVGGATNDWAMVSAGMYSTMAVKNDGTLWAWGRNNRGELGIGTSGTNQITPVQVGTANNWASVAVGGYHSAGLKTDGTLWVWGYNLSGELGIGNTTQQLNPVQVGSATDWSAVSAAWNYFTIALKTDKSVWAAGINTAGQLGIGSTTQQNSFVGSGSSNYPAYVSGLGGGSATLTQAPCGRVDVKGYYNFMHPTLPSSKLFAIHPRGNTGSFTVVYDTSRNTNTTPLVQSDAASATSLMGRLVTVTYTGTVSAGMRVRYYYSATDSTNASNALNSWISTHPGSTKQWQWIKYEGNAATMAGNQTAKGFIGGFTKLNPDSSGTESGVRFVEFWNITSFSTFGAIAFANQDNSTLGAVAQCWQKLIAGGSHAIAIKEDGTLWAWGNNGTGPLGIGNTTSQYSPVLVSEANWASAAAGNGFTVALKTDGTLWAWGTNTTGQLGIGNNTQQNSPVQIGTATNWAAVSASHSTTSVLALKTDGTLWAWGANATGQLGIGNLTDQNSPVQVGTDNNWAAIAMGGGHALAIKTNGTLWAWGANVSGQLGIGNMTDQTSPVQVGTATDWSAIWAGAAYSMALKTNGTLWTWGANGSGQLGIGSTANQTSPVQVGTATDWVTASAGAVHALARKTNGTLWAWGSNTNGQLGIGSLTSQSSPVQVGTATDWVAVAGGTVYSLVLKSDKRFWSWGANNNFQLGIGNPTQQTSPTLSGSSNYLTSAPGLGSSAVTLWQPTICDDYDVKGYQSFLSPTQTMRKLFAVHTQGNTGTFTVTYDASRNTNSSPRLQSDAANITSLMGRLVTVNYSGTIAAGMRVRVFFNASDSTSTSNSLNNWITAHPGAIKQWQWIKYEGDAAAMVAGQTAKGFSGTYTKLTPDSSGIENSVKFVEFWNITSFSTFGAIAYANTTNSTLPVTLHGFTARLQDNCSAVRLNWATASEQNSQDFTIQRSSNGTSWTNIGTVAAAGNSSVAKSYSFTDAAVSGSGTYYYRLQMNDIDGRKQHSTLVTVRLNCGTHQYFVYPNPVKDHITVQAPTGGGQKVLAVYNGTGQRMLQVNLQPGMVQSIPASGWNQGIYMVVITENNKQVHTQKVIKQ